MNTILYMIKREREEKRKKDGKMFYGKRMSKLRNDFEGFD